MLSPKLKEYIAGPHGMGIGTLDANLKPEFQRALGAIAIDDVHMKVFIDEPTAGRTFDNLREHPRLAVVMVSLVNVESYQFKGRCVRWEKTSGEDLEIFNSYMKEFDVLAVAFGFPPRGVYNYPHSAMITLIMEIDSIFEQSPRKGTGQKIF